MRIQINKWYFNPLLGSQLTVIMAKSVKARIKKQLKMVIAADVRNKTDRKDDTSITPGQLTHCQFTSTNEA